MTPLSKRHFVSTLLTLLIQAVLVSSTVAGTLNEGLVSYWPLDVVVGDKTPDLVSGYDLSAYVGAGHQLTNGNGIVLVPGHQGNCASFDNARQVLLGYVAGPSDELPLNKHPALTISLWANAAANQSDRRLFSEGSMSVNNPLFNIGSSSTGSSIDLFFRQQPTAAEVAAGFGDFGAGSHILSTQPAFDNTWHHIVLVQQEDGSRSLYIDGVLDGLQIPTKPAGAWNVNATSVGGILRSAAAAWVTGLIDEVAVWKRALTQEEIDEVRMSGLASVFPPLAEGLISHWPLDVVVGDKTPDLVSGYDLSAYVGAGHQLTNGNGIVLVPGHQGNCASFDNARQVLLGYVAGPTDDLPLNKYPALTISLWANAAANQSDRRLFSEGSMSVNNPLFNIGTTSSGDKIDLFFRQQPTAAEVAAGFGDFGAGSHILSTQTAYDSTWHHIVLVQQEDGTRSLYIDGVLDALPIPTKPAGAWNVNATSVGGILRSAAAAWVTGLIDEVAVWKRALTQEEIDAVRTDGVPQVPPRKRPLQVKSFVGDRPTVGIGESVVLSWDASPDANLAIAPGVGDVTALSSFGVGKTTVVVNATTTFTLTVSRGAESTNALTTVKAVPGVAVGWRYFDDFEELSPGYIGGQGGWQNALSSISGALTPANVVDSGAANQFLGFEKENVLAGRFLNSLTIPEGASNTLFFRFYIAPDPSDGTAPDIDINLGLTEKGLRDVQDFRGGNNGPSIRFFRQGGGLIDLRANNGVVGAAGSTVYSYITDGVANPEALGLDSGVVYNVWMDIENRPFDIVGNVQNGGDRYSVWLQRTGDADRVGLFEGFLSDRDGVNSDLVLGAAIPPLTQLFLCSNNQVTQQSSNKIRFDDFFLSAAGFIATVPVPAGAFSLPLRVSSVVVDPGVGVSLTWNATVGKTYTVNKKLSIVGAWSPLTTQHPAGGAVEETVTFTDSEALTKPEGYYQIVENP